MLLIMRSRIVKHTHLKIIFNTFIEIIEYNLNKNVLILVVRVVVTGDTLGNVCVLYPGEEDVLYQLCDTENSSDEVLEESYSQVTRKQTSQVIHLLM